jgi:hypothetical protein
MSQGVIKLLFVNYQNEWYGKVITAVEKFAEKGKTDDGVNFDHVAFVIDGYLYEAVQPILHKLPYIDIDFGEGATLVEKDVTVPNIEAAKEFAEKMVGRPYGLLTSCVLGGIHDVFGATPSMGEYYFHSDCSQYGALTIRAGGLNIDPGTPGACITPRDLYDAT